MKVRFIHQYFHPDRSSVSQVISQIAFYLAAQGDTVDVICSRNDYNGSRSGARPARESMNGVRVSRCWGPSFGKRSIAQRSLDMLSFCVGGAVHSLLSPKADSVVLLTNPPFFPVIGSLLKRIRGERFVHVLMDVYPEIAVRAGLLRKGSIAERALRSISRFTLHEADAVVVLGDDMKEVALRSGAHESKVVVIRNWADHLMILPIHPNENPLRKSWGLEGKFVVEYSGNLGVSHFFDDILAVAESLSDHDEIRFVFIGDGERRAEVDAYVASMRGSNVMLLPYQDSSFLSQSLSVGDLHYVSLRRGFEGLVVPSKAYGIMAAGRPIVYQGAENGEIARMVTREGIGRVVPPGDRKGLKDCILSLHRDRETRLRMGATARRVLEEKYPATKGLALYRKVLAGEQ